MSFPTPHTVQHLAYAGTTKNAHGNTIPAFKAAVARKVYGWASPNSLRSGEQKTAGVESVVVALELYAPTFPVGNRDRMVVDGNTFEVVGDAEDYNHGPFGFAPGMVVNLTRGR